MALPSSLTSCLPRSTQDACRYAHCPTSCTAAMHLASCALYHFCCYLHLHSAPGEKLYRRCVVLCCAVLCCDVFLCDAHMNSRQLFTCHDNHDLLCTRLLCMLYEWMCVAVATLSVLLCRVRALTVWLPTLGLQTRPCTPS